MTYKSLGQRTSYEAKDSELIDFIEGRTDNQENLDVEEVIELALDLTTEQLNFTSSKNHNDPNKLIHSKTAHCVGYASFCSTAINYLLKKYELDNDWQAKPQIGQLYLFGTNVHHYFESAFFKDHDFVLIENKSTGEVFAVDPSLDDYLFIDFVTYE